MPREEKREGPLCPFAPKDIIKMMMEDPWKRAVIQELLTKDSATLSKSSLPKIGPKKVHRSQNCESPTALHRRRALEAMRRNDEESSTSSSASSSEASAKPKEPVVVGPKLPYEQLLKGVVAFVDVRHRNEDKSAGIKAILKSMGATVLDQFTQKATHVVFKDGSFATFNKSKILGVHLVSVGWVDAIITHHARVPEKKYPAFGAAMTSDSVKTLSSQLQKEFQDILQDERRRSLSQGPAKDRSQSTQRRQTSFTSSSFQREEVTSSKTSPPQNVDGQEVQTFLAGPEEEELTSDDSMCGLVNGSPVKKSWRNVGRTVQSPQFTEDGSSPRSHSTATDDGTKSNVPSQTKHSLPDDSDLTKSGLGSVSYDKSGSMASLRLSESDRTKSGLATTRTTIDSIATNNNITDITKDSSRTSTMPSLRLSEDPSGLDNRASPVMSATSDRSTPDNLVMDIPEENVTVRKKKPASLAKDKHSEAIDSNSKTSVASARKTDSSNSDNSSKTSKTGKTPASKCLVRNPLFKPVSSQDKANRSKNDSTDDSAAESSARKKLRRSVRLDNDDTSKTKDQHVNDTASQTRQPSDDESDSSLREPVTLRKARALAKVHATPKSTQKENINNNELVTKHVGNKRQCQSQSPTNTPRKQLRFDVRSSSKESDEQTKDDSKNKRRASSVPLFTTPAKRTGPNNQKSPESPRSQGETARRKLYNPNESVELQLANDEAEREARRIRMKEKSKEKSAEKTAPVPIDIAPKPKEVGKQAESVTQRDKDTSSTFLNPNNVVMLVKPRGGDFGLSEDLINLLSKKNAEMEKECRKNKSKKTVAKSSDSESDQDEQRELLALFQKQDAVRRRSVRLSGKINSSDSDSSTVKTRKQQDTTAKPSSSQNQTNAKGSQANSSESDTAGQRNDSGSKQSSKGPKSQTTPKPSTSQSGSNAKRSQAISSESDTSTSIQSRKGAKSPRSKKPSPKKKSTTSTSTSSESDSSSQLTSDSELSTEARRRSLRHPARRCSMRVLLSQSKPKYKPTTDSSGTEKSKKQTSTSDSDYSISETSIQRTPVRRSSMDFESQGPSQRVVRTDKKQQPSMVVTRFHREEVLKFQQILKKLGKFRTEHNVSANTTHLIVGESKRTINLLKAIARGCWILKKDYLTKSLAAGRWLDEEPFELTEFSPAVQACRIQKEAFGPRYKIDLFKHCGKMFISAGTKPTTKDLKELVTTCGGTLTHKRKDAKIVVGCYYPFEEEVHCIKETWILDSITQNKLEPFDDYVIEPNTPLDSSDYD